MALFLLPLIKLKAVALSKVTVGMKAVAVKAGAGVKVAVGKTTYGAKYGAAKSGAYTQSKLSELKDVTDLMDSVPEEGENLYSSGVPLQVSSSWISYVQFDKNNKILQVLTKTGASFNIKNFLDKDMDDLIAGSSPGKMVNKYKQGGLVGALSLPNLIPTKGINKVKNTLKSPLKASLRSIKTPKLSTPKLKTPKL